MSVTRAGSTCLRQAGFREQWRGFLWQGRFSSAVMDESYLLNVTAYTERNPVKAHLTARAEHWPWSSAAAHVSGDADGIAETDWLSERVAGWLCTWGEYLAREDCDLPAAGRIRRPSAAAWRNDRPSDRRRRLPRLHRRADRPRPDAEEAWA